MNVLQILPDKSTEGKLYWTNKKAANLTALKDICAEMKRAIMLLVCNLPLPFWLSSLQDDFYILQQILRTQVIYCFAITSYNMLFD